VEEQNQLEISPSRCPKCDGTLVFAPDRDCLACVACGRIEAIRNLGRKPAALSVESYLYSRSEALERPSALLPFRLTREQAVEKVKAWLAGEGLREDASVTLTEAIYLPFILFRIDASASYMGERSEYNTETTEMRGLRDSQGYALEQRSTKRVPIPANGYVMRRHMPVRVKAFDKLPNNFVASLVDWNYDDLLPFNEAYLAGFAASRPKMNLNRAYKEAQETATGILEIIACEEIGGNEPKVLSLKPSLSHATFQPILIPVYTGSYKFNGQLYHFAINGNTGELKGTAPETLTNNLKKWLSYAGGAALLALVYTLWMLFNDYDTEQIVGIPIMLGVMTGAFLFFLWLHTRIHIWLAALVYALASVSVVYLLWVVTESDFIVKGTGALLGVMSLLILPALFMKDKDKKAQQPNLEKKSNKRI
jgi:hypothetical protein